MTFFSLLRWGILFSHPRDFTPVCTTELGRAAKLAPEFAKRNVKMIALSIDSVEDHLAWSKDRDDPGVIIILIGNIKCHKNIAMYVLSFGQSQTLHTHTHTHKILNVTQVVWGTKLKNLFKTSLFLFPENK